MDDRPKKGEEINMEHNMSNPCRRILALVLCFAMLVPMLPTRVFAADPTVYDVEFGAAGYIVEDEIVAANAKVTETSTELIKFVRKNSANDLEESKKYVIMSDKYEVIMSYKAVSETGKRNSITSIVYAADGHAENAYQYMDANEDVVYLGHSQRDEALWALNSLLADDAATDVNESKTLNKREAYFGTGAVNYVQFHKGAGPTFAADGSYTSTGNGAYWYSVKATQYRYLDHRYISANLYLSSTDLATEDGDHYRYSLESFDDGTFLLYWHSKDYNVIRVFYYDAVDGWTGKEYRNEESDTMTLAEAVAATKAEIEADLAELKLRLYRYAFDTAGSGKLSVGMTGYTTFRVPAGTSKADVLQIIEKNGKLKVFDADRDHIPVPYDNTNNSTAKIGYYWLDSSSFVDTNTDFTVKVMYSQDDGNDKKIGELKVDYESKSYTEFAKLGIVAVGAGVGAKVQQINPDGSYSDMTFALTENGETVNIPITVGMLTYTADDENGHKAGNIVDTSKATDVNGQSPITGLTLTYDGLVICTDFKLNVGFPDDVKEYAWGQPGSVLADKEGTTTEVDFSNSGVANIQLSASSIPLEKGVDLIIVMDLSGSMRSATDGNDILFQADEKEEALKDPKWEQTRVYAMEQALRTMLETLATNDADVRIAMSDFGDIDHYEFDGAVLDTSIRDTFYFNASLNNTQNNGYEFYNHLNFVINKYDRQYDEQLMPETGYTYKAEAGPYGIADSKVNMAHPLYTGKITPTVYTGDGTVQYTAFEDVKDLYANFDEVVDKINDNAFLDYGTNYDVGLEYAYQLGYSVQQKNIANGEDRQTVCIFLSDGAAMQYNYFSGSTISDSWKNWLTGNADDLLNNDPLTLTPENVTNLNTIATSLLTALTTQQSAKNSTISKLENWEYNRGQVTTDGYLYYRPDLDTGADDFYTLMGDQGHDLDWDYLCQLAKLNGITDFTYEKYQSDTTMATLRELLIVDESEQATAKKATVDAPSGTPEDRVGPDGELLDENGNTVWRYVSQLKDPSRQVDHYYPRYTGTPDTSKSAYEQFVAAYEEVTGEKCTIDIFTRIAYKNRKTFEANGDTTNVLLTDLVTALKTPTDGKDHQTYSPYYYFYNADGKNWMAEAMKGDADKLYPVINKYAKEDNHEAVFNYYGDVRNKYDSQSNLALDGQDYISGFRGLNMELYTIMFSVSDANLLTTDVTEGVLQNIASGRNYDYDANDLEELNKAFKQIIDSMIVSATKAWYTDTMGNDYDLYTGIDKDGDGQDDLMDEGDAPKIQVLQYEMEGTQATDKYEVIETITFNHTTGFRQAVDKDGNYFVEEYTLATPLKAVSDKVVTSVDMIETVIVNGKKVNQTTRVRNYVDIWGADGVIAGEYVSYNTNTSGSVYIEFGDQGRYPLAAESFFWTIGNLGHSKFVLEYDVILEGIEDGTRELNSSKKYYDTNESARLTYVNYLGITRYQEPASPKYPWGADTEIVVDYGLPVYIDVPEYGKGFTLEYVGFLGTGDVPEHGPLADGFAASAKGQFGTLEVVGDRVKYTFEAKNMSMNTTERFAMALLAEEYENGEVVKNYYYVPVTVVPATTIYYEDNFLEYGTFDENGNETTDIYWFNGSYYVTGSADWLGGYWGSNGSFDKMTAGENNTYTKVYEHVATGEYSLKVNVGSWALSWGAENGGDYTFKVNTTSTVIVTFDADTTKVSVEIVEEENDDPVGPTYYVAGSPELCTSNWDAADANNLMTKGSDGRYFKVYENVAPSSYSLKITNGTWDTSWGNEHGNNYTFHVGTTCTVTVYFNPTTQTVSVEGDGLVDDSQIETKYYVAGSGALCNGKEWDPAAAENMMTMGDDGLYSIVYENVVSGTYELKVTNGTWDQAWGSEGMENYKFAVSSTSTVIVTFDAESKKVNVQVIAVASVAAFAVERAVDNGYYVTGDADWLGGNFGWGTDNVVQDPALFDEMTARENGIYTKVYANVPAGSHSLKVKQGRDLDWTRSWGNGAGEHATNYSFNVATTSTVIVIFDSVNGNIIVEVEKNHTSSPEILGDYEKRNYYVVGTGIFGGWDNNTTGLLTDNGVGLYSKTYTDVEVGEYQLKVNIGDWSQSWGNNGENISVKVTEVTDVTVYFNAVTGNVYVELASGTDVSADTKYYVVGSDDTFLGGWNNNLTGEMTDNGSGRHSKVYENVAAGDYQLKINVGDWSISWGNGSGADTNYRFSVKSTSTVTVYFEPETGNITVYVVAVDNEEHFQDTDRPGTDNLMEGLKDAENVYGFDNAYTSMTTHSLGESMMVTLKPGYYATATFSFWGTGFDVISLTNRNTGTILVTVHEKEAYDKDGSKAPVVKYFMVDTYYGYKYENGEWIVDPTVTDTLYQVPVVQIEGLDYGNYTAVITAQYSSFLDHFKPEGAEASYDFYLDAIRIYDPANDGADNETIKDAYVADGEGWPEYVELRDVLLDVDTFDGLNGHRTPAAVFIDGKNGSYNVTDYMNYGPNNELYLADYQRVVFGLNVPANVAKVQIGLKTHKGSTEVEINGEVLNVSSTDMYYDLTSFNGKNVSIENIGTEVLSITNIKVTYKAAPEKAAGYSLFSVNRSSVEAMLNELNASMKDDSFVLVGANTVLGSELAMNFFVNAADLNGTDYYAEIKLYTEDGVVTTTVPYADWEVRGDHLVVSQKGLAARQMADKIEVVIYNGDGTQASDVWTDSIRDYAMRILDDQDAETKTMLVDMLNYGAAAQSFFDYNTADLANSLLTEAQKACASESVNVNDQSVKGEGYVGSSLTLKDRILMTMYFENITTDMYAVVSFTDHKGNAHEIVVEGSSFSKYDETTYGVVVDELVVADGAQMVNVTVYDAEGNAVASAADSVNSYAARQMGGSALYEMIAKFTASAYAYFH